MKKKVLLKTAGTFLTVIGCVVSLIGGKVEEARRNEEMREIANEVYDKRTKKNDEES